MGPNTLEGNSLGPGLLSGHLGLAPPPHTLLQMNGMYLDAAGIDYPDAIRPVVVEHSRWQMCSMARCRWVRCNVSDASLQQLTRTSNERRLQRAVARATGDPLKGQSDEDIGFVNSDKGVEGVAPGQPTHMVLKLLTPMRALTRPPALTYKYHSQVCSRPSCHLCF